jgi:formylmethanofuran dehydrogenase subunit E-like metal-binding protein
VGGEETLSILDPIYEQLGCSQGRGNLILLRSEPHHPHYLFFFNREKEKAAYFEINSKLRLENLENKKQEEIFSRIIVTDLSREELFKNPMRWEKRSKEKIFGGNEVRLISVSFLWMEGLPQEVIKAAEIHDHICPGLLSGYFIVKFVLEELPPREGMDYFIIGSPVWCKDDMIQSMLNMTPGKRNFVVLPLTDKEKEHLKDKNAAGIFLQFDRKMGGGKGLVIGLDWDKFQGDAGVKREGFPWEWRLRLALYMARHLKDYQKYVYVIKKFDMEKGERPETYFSLGINPWKKIGLWIE